MLEKELIHKIANDKQLKTLVNDIRGQLISKNIPDSIDKTEKIILGNLETIEEYLAKHIQCDSNPLDECLQINKGYEDSITYESGVFYLGIKHCEHWYHDHKYENLKKSFIYIDYDLDQFNYNIKEYLLNELNPESNLFTPEEIGFRKSFFKNVVTSFFEKNQSTKGIYLQGEPGVGKTTLMKVIANEFAYRGEKQIAFIAVPNLISLVKDSFNLKSEKNVSLTEKLKKADVLFLDDIGAENVTSWLRDDLLFSILNFRMENNKLTFFTSNFDFNKLNLSYKIKGADSRIESIKQKRFIERIKALTVVYQLNGNSHR
ncbi:primosomal protein DnaI [Williamsoniiplasma somnilux]|uniref:Primosomal protein DnaI n=1 Tax=Williamsoniiplasma somnilux TaxID=215578 RepID=A0A2K8P0Q1_9MOLU|nr:ATP-binding protein [Williamsoniiplasma somnilux]ATZ18581.1 primosomal protein DnaI [Williamsoniiplasma somnilux]